MRIEKFLEFSREVEIELDAKDIHLIFEEPESLPVILRGLNDIAGFLKGIPDKKIEEMNDGQRSIVAEFLSTQANRYTGGE